MRPHDISSSFQELKVVCFRFVGSYQLNSGLIKSKVVSKFVGTDKPTEILHSFAEMRICKGWIKTWTLWWWEAQNRLKVTSFGDPQHQEKKNYTQYATKNKILILVMLIQFCA